MAGTLPGFDPTEFRDAIHLVQNMAAPEVVADQATFYFPAAPPAAGTDAEGVPFDITKSAVEVPTKDPVQVPCTVEYAEGSTQLSNFGVLVPSRIVVTLLDVDYEQVEGFSVVEVAGTPYHYQTTQVPSALGSVVVYQVHCQAEDEG